MSFFFLKDLNEHLTQAFVGFVFRENDADASNFIVPKFYIGALPPRRKHNDPSCLDSGYFPFVVNRITAGQDDSDGAILTVKTICGIYTAEGIEGGEQDIINMISVARGSILKSRTIGAFLLQLPVKWSLGNSKEYFGQAHPHYMGEIESTWRTPVVEQLLSIDDELTVFGSGYK